MTKEQFNLLTVLEQINHVNQLLKDGQSLRTISDNLNLSKSTIRERAKKIDYIYNDELKAYTSVKDGAIQIPSKDETKPLAKQEATKNTIIDKTLDKGTKQDNSPLFSIPNKAKNKADTQAFNIVMKKSLVKLIDNKAKKNGGYSRNELINMMCAWCMDNLKD